MSRFHRLLLAAIVAALAAGCSGPPSPQWPELVPDDVARRALTQYDKNHDGRIDAEELKASPPLQEAMAMMDVNHEGSLTAAKIAERVRKWLNGGTIVFRPMVSVSLDGQPLEGAAVTFEPEAFMGPAYKPTSAVTDKAGTCLPPGDDPQFKGLHPGLYRVRISKKVNGQETLPACYNTSTVLAREVAADLPRTKRMALGVFRLSSEGTTE